ncbi:MAG: hypothetical protein IPL74_07895, partial [Bacteroidetes bacterium]|nr:hypothetical protein [Bacteroidota bacterium]
MASDIDPMNDAMFAETRIKQTIAGTVSSVDTSFCVTGNPILSLAGNYGGTVQWMESTTSVSGPFSNVGTNASTYTPGTITQTTWYKAVVICGLISATSNVVQISVNNPSITSTSPASRCGIGTVTLGATGNGIIFNWYDSLSSLTPVGTGATFTTPVIST